MRGLRTAAIAVVVVVAGYLLVVFVRRFATQKPTSQRPVAQVIQMIRPPPPPPPTEPPPPPPPQEKTQEVLQPDTPDPAQSPDAAPLGLDADGTAGGDAFGLAARKGGADLVGTGSSFFNRYTGLVKDAVLDKLSEEESIRRGSYAVVVRVWVGKDGRIERVALSQGSGKRDLDLAIEKALSRLARVSESPPLEMPQPVTLRIVSRG
jgi:protein TonB